MSVRNVQGTPAAMAAATRSKEDALGHWSSLGRMMYTDKDLDWYAVGSLANGALIAVGDTFTWRYFESGQGLPEPGWYPQGMVSLKFLNQGRSTLTPLPDGSMLAIGVNVDYSPMLDTNRTLVRRYIQDAPQNWHWAEQPAPPVGCLGHAATLLGNGKVMVAGGMDPAFHPQADDPQPLRADTQLFDPATRTWRIVQPLLKPRRNAALVALDSATSAMIVGGMLDGDDPYAHTASAEVYLSGDGWHAIPPMKTARRAPSALRLRDGRVIVASDETIEVYHPGLERWEEPVQTVAPVGDGPPLAQLRNGMVLIGVDQVYDPIERVCKPIARNPALLDSSFVPFCSTRVGDVVLLAPQTDPEGVPTGNESGGTGWLFDIEGDTDQQHLPGKWVRLPEPAETEGIGGHNLAPLPGGQLLATDGHQSHRYDRKAWQPAGKVPVLLSDRLFSSLIPLRDGAVLAIGMNNDFNEYSDTNNLLSATYTQTAGWSAPSRLVAQRASYAAAMMRDGNVLVAGGFDLTQNYPAQNTQALPSAELYDARARMWRETVPMNTPRMWFAMAALPDQDAVVAFGGKSSMTGDGALNTVEMYVVEEGAKLWLPMPPMRYPRIFPAALTLPDGRIVVASDDTLEVFDVRTQRWEDPVPLLSGIGALPILARLRDGTVMVGDNQLYDPVARRCRRINPNPFPAYMPAWCATTLDTVVIWPGAVLEFDIDGR
jgi:hypothetical protein